jgi:two-component system chemotaxis response regulator CheY
MTRRVLDVGNCSFDHDIIRALISANFDAQAAAASLQDEALKMLRAGHFDLVLVNRKLAADSSQGVDLIERMKADPQLADVPVMLLSNYPEAQRAAVAAGAQPGFGKAELDHPETLEKLARFLGS